MLAPVIKYAINKAKRNKYIQHLFEAPFELHKLDKIGEFTDSYGNTFKLLGGLRTKIKPGWERMLRSEKTKITSEYLLRQKQNGFIAANKMVPMLNALGKSVENSDILEIGCHSGATSFAMADMGANKVVGTEFSGYKVEAVDMEHANNEAKLNEVDDDLKTIRTSLSHLFKQGERVTFVDDDICHSSLDPNTFDIICSWEVLEHLHDPEKAFQSIYTLLKEGGISIHEYNPFFCLNGGHSLCTLDFLWGHTILNDADFSRYLDEIRPQEKERALSFYRKGLNRMTLHDLKVQIEKSGLELISILPFTKEQHLRMVDEKTLRQSQRHYPNLTLLDLAAPRVFVIVRKGRRTE